MSGSVNGTEQVQQILSELTTAQKGRLGTFFEAEKLNEIAKEFPDKMKKLRKLSTELWTGKGVVQLQLELPRSLVSQGVAPVVSGVNMNQINQMNDAVVQSSAESSAEGALQPAELANEENLVTQEPIDLPTPAPTAALQPVYSPFDVMHVHVLRVEARKQFKGWVVAKDYGQEGMLLDLPNLEKLSETIPLNLGALTLPAGVYSRMRLILGDGSTFQAKEKVNGVEEVVPKQLVVNSGNPKRIRFLHPFVVEDGKVTTLGGAIKQTVTLFKNKRQKGNIKQVKLDWNIVPQTFRLQKIEEKQI